MNQTTPAIDPAVHDLAVGCIVAHAVMASSQTAADSRPIRMLKRHLLRIHRRHLDRLCGHGLQPAARVRTGLRNLTCSDLCSALQSANDEVVIGACRLLERAMLAAYDRTLARASVGSHLRRLLVRQRQELKSCHEYCVSQVSAWKSGTHPGRPRAQSPGQVLATAA